jgi:HEAT repeat protein
MVRQAKGEGGSGADREALAAIWAAADASAYETLIGLLDDPSGSVARAAAVALGSSGPAAVEPLIRALYSRSPGSVLAERSLVALGACCARPVLEEAIATKDVRVRATLLSVLGLTCDAGAFGGLLEVAIESMDIFSARPAANAVARLGSCLPLEMLERALNEPAQEVLSSSAASALSTRGEEGARVLLAAVGSKRSRTARIAARELATMGGVAVKAGASGIPQAEGTGPELELLATARMARARAFQSLSAALEPLLPSSNPLQAAAAVGLLAGCGPPAVDLLGLVVMSCAPARERAAAALADINTPDSLYTLRYLAQDEHPPVRLSAACAMVETGDEVGLDAIEDILEKGDVVSKCRAAKALAGIADEKGFDLLSDASKDPDARVRHAARRSLAMTWPARRPDLLELELVTVRPDRPHRFKLSEEELAREVGRLSSESPAVRLAAVRNLGAIGDAGAAAALADALIDPDDRVALEARIALDRLEV